jgi:RimJ/RimL family protein N-acetyltransferase
MSGAKVYIDSGPYLIRTLTEEDASDRWLAWMADPDVTRMLNTQPSKMTRRQLVDYIKSFDLRSKLLWGIFDKPTGRHIGFFTVQADHQNSQGLVNLLIGEPEFRNHGVLSTVRLQFAEYFFETLGLKLMMATALAHNQIIINTLIKAGWKVDRILKQHTTSRADGSKLDLYLMTLSREDWRQRNKPDRAAPSGS